MGRFSFPASMPSNGIKSTILYARPFRTQIAVLLPLIVLMNFGIFIVCCMAVGLEKSRRTHRYNRFFRDDETEYLYKDPTSTAAMFFFFIPLPLAVLINSVVDSYKRYRRTLQPMRVAVSAAASFTTWGVAAGLWSPCIYPPWNYKGVGYCPFISGEGWNWIGKDMTPPESYYVIPWLLLPSAVLYLIYLFFGCMALRYLRRENHIQSESTYHHEMYPENQSHLPYKMTANVYSEPYLTPESLPSTRPSQVASPPQTVRPPSYNKSVGTPSRSASSYYSEPRDTKHSHGHQACTCQCHH